MAEVHLLGEVPFSAPSKPPRSNPSGNAVHPHKRQGAKGFMLPSSASIEDPCCGDRGIELDLYSKLDTSSSGQRHLDKFSWARDARNERQANGVIKWGPEFGVPDVGGMSWRTKDGHLIKDQSYYSARPHQHLWDCPAHAGPKTWREFHGPRLRTDAPILDKLEELDEEQSRWEAKKAFVNTTRLQTLDRLNAKRIENEQREVASTWAPHRRALRELHDSYSIVASELDSMPMKELKKVFTPAILQRDRNAVLVIADRIAAEEELNRAWRDAAQGRHDEIRASLSNRARCNDVLTDLSGQRCPDREISPRAHRPIHVEDERSQHKALDGQGKGDVFNNVDLKGLIHVSYPHALEARFPGTGHQKAMQLRMKANATIGDTAQHKQEELEASPLTSRSSARRETIGLGAGHSVATRPVPVPPARVKQVSIGRRESVEVLCCIAAIQFQDSQAPPPPPQQMLVMQDQAADMVRTAIHDPGMRRRSTTFGDTLQESVAQALAERSVATTQSTGSVMCTTASLVDVAPPQPPLSYPVLVKTNIDDVVIQVPGGRRKSMSADPRRQLYLERKEANEAAKAATIVVNSARGSRARMGRPTIAQRPTMRTVCSEIQHFEETAKPAPLIGNHWRRLHKPLMPLQSSPPEDFCSPASSDMLGQAGQGQPLVTHQGSFDSEIE